MIDTTRKQAVKQTGLNVYTVGDTPTQLYTYGKILLIRKDHCIVLASAGPDAGKKVQLPLEFPATVNGIEYYVDFPTPLPIDMQMPSKAELAELEQQVAQLKAQIAGHPTTRQRPAKGESKLDKCRAILKAAPVGAAKADVVAKFISDALCTPAGANTYYLLLKKEK
jgi:hypothetical protein